MERLQRILAARGVSSRRAAEEMIKAGRVSLDGVIVTQLGTQADPIRSVIKVDGKVLKPQRPRYLLMNKPRGYITTMKDERDRRTVMDLVSIPERVYPVGRLDRDTEGLLLLTNDGDVANRVMHPRYELTKEYQVLTESRPTDATIQRLRDGLVIEGKRIVPEEVRVIRESTEGLLIKIVVHEGMNHLVRRMMDAVGIPIERLRRVRVGPLSITGVQLGTWRELTQGELKGLLEALHLDRVGNLNADEQPQRFDAPRQKEAPAKRGGYGPKSPRRQRPDPLDLLTDGAPEEREQGRRPAAGGGYDRGRQQRPERREVIEPGVQDRRYAPPTRNPRNDDDRAHRAHRDDRDRARFEQRSVPPGRDDNRGQREPIRFESRDDRGTSRDGRQSDDRRPSGPPRDPVRFEERSRPRDDRGGQSWDREPRQFSGRPDQRNDFQRPEREDRRPYLRDPDQDRTRRDDRDGDDRRRPDNRYSERHAGPTAPRTNRDEPSGRRGRQRPTVPRDDARRTEQDSRGRGDNPRPRREEWSDQPRGRSGPPSSPGRYVRRDDIDRPSQPRGRSGPPSAPGRHERRDDNDRPSQPRGHSGPPSAPGRYERLDDRPSQPHGRSGPPSAPGRYERRDDNDRNGRSRAPYRGPRQPQRYANDRPDNQRRQTFDDRERGQARDDEQGFTPQGDRDRWSGGSGQDNRGPRARRPPRRDLP